MTVRGSTFTLALAGALLAGCSSSVSGDGGSASSPVSAATGRSVVRQTPSVTPIQPSPSASVSADEKPPGANHAVQQYPRVVTTGFILSLIDDKPSASFNYLYINAHQDFKSLRSWQKFFTAVKSVFGGSSRKLTFVHEQSGGLLPVTVNSFFKDRTGVSGHQTLTEVYRFASGYPRTTFTLTVMLVEDGAGDWWIADCVNHPTKK